MYRSLTLPFGTWQAVFKYDGYDGSLTIDLDKLRSTLKEQIIEKGVTEEEAHLYKMHLVCQDRLVCTIKSHPDNGWDPYLLVHGPEEGDPRHGW